MENLGYYNGTYDLIENMQIPMDDRGCYFGDGVYEATYAANHIVYAIDEHLDRLYNSAGLLKIKIPYTKEEIKDILNTMVKKVDSKDQFVYWQVTRGTAPRNHSFPDEQMTGNLWITLRPRDFKNINLKKKIKLITMEDTRFLHCNIKTLNLIPNVMANQKAHEEGCFEAVFHRDDRVTECSHSNVSILKDGIFITPPNDHFILPSITRNRLVSICKKVGIPVDETPFNLDQLMEADEIMVASASTFCVSADAIDGRPVGGKAPELLELIQRELLKDFEDETGYQIAL